jgi:pimeloyl-ACP methyl ester carboxylesterase
MDTDVLRNLKTASRAVCHKGPISGLVLVGLLSLLSGCVLDWSHSPGRVLDASSAADGGSDADSDSEGGANSVLDAELADPDDAARLLALRELFYTDSWTGHSHLFGDPTMSPEESRAHLRASNRHDAWDVLPLIEAPTLVLHGTDDLMVPSANAPLLVARIPGAVMHLHEGGRHGFFDEFAADIVPVIDDFLDGEDG